MVEFESAEQAAEAINTLHLSEVSTFLQNHIILVVLLHGTSYTRNAAIR